MATTQSIIEILIQAVDESAAALAGTQAGAALTASYGGIVSSAASVQESQDSLKQAVTDAMAGASQSTGAYSTQVAFLQDKINGYKASIAEANAALDKNTGTTVAVAAAHAKAAADIATDQANIAKYQEQLDLLTNSQNLNGQSAAGITAQLEGQANANVSLGFSVSDSTQSLMQAFTATKSVSEAMQVNSVAMDLARAKNLDIGTATNQVILAMEGQGRALATYGIQIKDGLSGMQALNAVQGAVNGQAQAYAATLSGSLAVALQSFNKLMADMGSTQLPLLTKLLEFIVKIIDTVDGWTQKHQKLTEVILVFVGVLGVMLTLLGALLVIVATVGLAIAGGLSATFVGIAAAVAVAIAALVAIGVAIVANWDWIKTHWEDLVAFLFPGIGALVDFFVDHFQQIYDGTVKILGEAWNWIKTTFKETVEVVEFALNAYMGFWTNVWHGIETVVVDVWTVIKNTVKSGVNDVISAINGFINALDSIHINIPAIQIPGTKIGTPALDLGFNIPDIPMLAAGGIVYNPVLAMIGEQGPEAVVPLSSYGGGGLGGGQPIQIFIQGGNYLDQNGATMIGNALAQQIIRQIRVSNYRS